MNKVEFPVVLFMDGHSAHINLAVAEFCRDKQIIIYCFPPHASHILQPLDVAVFGPLKKSWNTAVEEFKSKFQLPVTKKNFFQVFDPAWQKCKEKKHAIAGFRATGLVPFNVENVDYSKILLKKTNANVKTRDPSESMNPDQKLGVSIAFQAFVEILSPEQLVSFERRMEEDYNIVDETDSNKLWRTYKILKLMKKDSVTKTSKEVLNMSSPIVDASTSVQERITIHVDDSIIVQEAIIVQGDISTCQAPTITATSSPIHETPAAPLDLSADDLPNLSQIAGPSNAEKPSYVEHEAPSPFKKLYMKIASDSMAPSRKLSKRKVKTPTAIAASHFIDHLRKTQEEKEEKERQKDERKRMREEKKKEKTSIAASKKKKKNRERAESESSSIPETDEDDEIIYASSDEDEVFDENNCGACGGNTDWEIGSKWIGCNGCIRWFHKSCLSEEIESMSVQDLKKLDFKCNDCLKRGKQRRK